MEADLVAQRCALFYLSHRHPDWTYAELAEKVGRSESWVNKWLARFKQATAADLSLFQSRSHARHTPPPTTPPPVVDRILALRDEPPAHLRRVPGPRTILAFLQRDPEALALALPLPRSTRTVWKVLRRAGRIEADLPHVHQPLELPAPLCEVQADFTDIGTVPPDPQRPAEARGRGAAVRGRRQSARRLLRDLL
jgi:Homeodomain-like domain